MDARACSFEFSQLLGSGRGARWARCGSKEGAAPAAKRHRPTKSVFGCHCQARLRAAASQYVSASIYVCRRRVDGGTGCGGGSGSHNM